MSYNFIVNFFIKEKDIIIIYNLKETYSVWDDHDIGNISKFYSKYISPKRKFPVTVMLK